MMFRYVPRIYRQIVARTLVCFAVCFVVYQMLATEQATTGTGRSDESHFRFDYDDVDDERAAGGDYDIRQSEDGIIHERALAPGPHRDEAGDDIIEKITIDDGADVDADARKANFSEKSLFDPDAEVDYFSVDELAPYFPKPKADPSSPGEFGKAYKVTDESQEVKLKVKKGWDDHAFNHFACEQISLHRTIADKRDKECKVDKNGKPHRWRKPLPTTSVIIIFHNEAWCTLLRTVHSVLETSPAVLLKEILLVDDASTNKNLGSELDSYIEDLKVVRVIRMPERSGLIRARLAGAEQATGDVLTFLDSHCECAPFWLEPLLEAIAEDPTRVVCPVIEVIDAETFAMSITSARHVPIGAFGWGLEFRWSTQPGNRGMEIQKNERDQPVTTPVMAGAAFSVYKKQFDHLGAYDLNMDGAGSENLELSFRVWMCGGAIEIHPCSRVGHVGRRRKPYVTEDEADRIVTNKMVVAETWMDDFKWMFYRRTPKARELPVPDVSERRAQLHQMQCGNFEWYMKHVAPDTHIVMNTDVITHGEIRPGTDESYCVDSNNVHGNPGSVLDLATCRGLGKGQYFELTQQGELRQNTISELCLAANENGSNVWTEKCRYPWHETPDSHKWLFLPEGRLYHVPSDRCLTFNIKKLSVNLLKCVKGTAQMWIFNQKDGYEEDFTESEDATENPDSEDTSDVVSTDILLDYPARQEHNFTITTEREEPL